MVNHVIITAEVFVFVAEGVQAVRTGGDDFVKFVLLKGRHILLGHDLKGVLISHAPRGVPGAGLFGSQDSIIDPCLVHDPGYALSDFLVAWVEGTGASDPEEDVGFFFVGHDRDLDSGVLGPFKSALCRDPPGVARVSGALEALGCLGGWGALGQGEVAAKLGEGGDVVDEYGALFHAGAASRAGPELIFGDEIAYQGCGLFSIPKLCFVEAVPNFGDDVHGR